MLHLITELSKYTMIILFALYTYQCFSALKRSVDKEEQAEKYRSQVVYMYLFHLNAYAVLYLSMDKNLEVLKFYLMQVAFFAVVQVCYSIFYRRVSRLVVNNMCMLMCIGFVMLTRLSYDHAMKQFQIAVVSMALTMLIPFFISRFKYLKSLTWLYALAGITMLGVVAVLGAVSHGAKLSFTVAGIAVQPSEFIKIIFVFFVASMFYESTEFIQVVKATVIAGLHVIILVLSKDLGAGLIFFIAYMVMLYVATRKLYYFFGGLFCGAVASVIAYYLFNHVRVRVVAWQDPLAVFEREGNQVANSLFAIGTGGWFGMGLNQGMPNKIPEVKQDFIFSAVAEELGGIFAICLILVCVSCFLMFLNIAMQMKDSFYKLVALGLGTIYGFQILLSVGGDIKFIPSTGVTLPLVSYGGSSLLSTLIIFAIIQGLYLLRERTETEQAPERKKKKKTGSKSSSSKKKSSVRKGGAASHEENIHGTKIEDFD
ncbi:MAG: FtsW/RodA/SpoVE family cell cycle protein [Lachnospiraceae bacterium]|nr:FtsW/RodA/SpoVE family cell cycle protein [Lachnospiraceae bacterium]